MHKIYSILIVLVFSLPAFAQLDRTKIPEAGPAPEIKIGAYDQFTLDNGLKVIVVNNDKLPRVSFSLSLDYKPFHEGDIVGYSSIAGQLLNTGTTNRTKAELDDEIDFIGASVSASATGIFASSLTKHQDKLLELMTDVLFNPSFPEDELEKIRKQTISGLAQYKESPDQIASTVSDVIRYGKDHPYGEVTTVENVEKISLEDCKQFYQNYFKPNIAYLTIVGDITLEQAKPLVEKYFSSWESAEVPAPSYDMPERPEKTKVIFVDRPQSVQSVIRVTYPIDLRPGTADVIPSSLMNTILGGGFSSNLLQNLRETHGYTYAVWSTISSDRLVGSFTVNTSVRNEVTDSAVAEILVELERLREEPVDEEQLQSIKNYMTGGFARALESPQTIARFARNIERYGLPKDYYATYLKKLDAVSISDIQKMAGKYLSPDNAYILIVGKKEEVAESLENAFDVEYLDVYGDPIAEMEVNVEASEVIGSYLEAIGGVDKVKAVSSIMMKAEAQVQGMTFGIKSVKSSPNRSVNTVSMGGSVMQKRIYDNGDAKIFVQGNPVPVSDKDKALLKNSTPIFPELLYGEQGYELKVTGIQKIGEENAYQVKIKFPDGNEVLHYYGVDSKLKLKTESQTEGEVSYSDYREIDGILFPFKTSASTPQGFLEAKILEVEINKPVDESLFEE